MEAEAVQWELQQGWLLGLEVVCMVVSHEGGLMAGSTKYTEGAGSTYVLAHQLPPPCQ